MCKVEGRGIFLSIRRGISAKVPTNFLPALELEVVLVFITIYQHIKKNIENCPKLRTCDPDTASHRFVI